MRALTLHQPWASLVMLGLKRFETRDWDTSYRGPLVIHAGKDRKQGLGLWGDLERLRDLRPLFDESKERWLPTAFEDLPFGAALGVVDVVNTHFTGYLLGHATGRALFEAHAAPGELGFGDFSDGRVAWRLANPKPFDPPVPARGYQRLWSWPPKAARAERISA